MNSQSGPAARRCKTEVAERAVQAERAALKISSKPTTKQHHLALSTESPRPSQSLFMTEVPSIVCPYSNANDRSGAPAEVKASLFVSSMPIPDYFQPVQGPNFEEEQGVESLLDAFACVGFQATGMHKAAEIMEKMVGDAISTVPDSPLMS